jgi:hypothetical protein
VVIRAKEHEGASSLCVLRASGHIDRLRGKKRKETLSFRSLAEDGLICGEIHKGKRTNEYTRARETGLLSRSVPVPSTFPAKPLTSTTNGMMLNRHQISSHTKARVAQVDIHAPVYGH